MEEIYTVETVVKIKTSDTTLFKMLLRDTELEVLEEALEILKKMTGTKTKVRCIETEIRYKKKDKISNVPKCVWKEWDRVIKMFRRKNRNGI